ncbi:thiolase family protein [Alcaligenes endophyticus]|uniref:Thiolase family protein n=1 Tax=Alcaligenes endophyticus TaxID=1929088 RepID=A0ABT8EF23_9BURK|nr:thiolase family protein [Alcaligenes endophyticus]MCX5590456.1 thiolase family protein [Alcaligenes endophyticus]MDN4119880.1 thiolase family protein [Alcaligenes endophyticus]
MSLDLTAQGGIYVVGIGMHAYQFPSDTPYTVLGLTAVRQALQDAALKWSDIQAAYVGTTSLGMAAGKVMLQHLGPSNLEVVQIENASASGSYAFRQACLAIISGAHDTVLVTGIDKHGNVRRAADYDGLEHLSSTETIPAVHFALLAQKYLKQHNLPVEAMAKVAVKNRKNAALNPYAQHRREKTLAEVMSSTSVAGALTAQQCCPRGEGASAVILMSGKAIERMGICPERAICVRASVAASEQINPNVECSITELVKQTAFDAYKQAGIEPKELDLLELHDAFSVEELIYSEAMGLCDIGMGSHYLEQGHSAIGGQCAINASGGLIGMGHPLGPTGIGQIAEITRQLRGEAGPRQHPNPRIGMAHMIGLGSVGIAHILSKSGNT